MEKRKPERRNLDGQYAAFGKVVEGMDVVDKIANRTGAAVGCEVSRVGRSTVYNRTLMSPEAKNNQISSVLARPFMV